MQLLKHSAVFAAVLVPTNYLFEYLLSVDVSASQLVAVLIPFAIASIISDRVYPYPVTEENESNV